MSKVTLEVEPGDAVRIGADTIVRVIQKSGRRVRLQIESEYRVHHTLGDEPTPPRPVAKKPIQGIRRPEPAGRID